MVGLRGSDQDLRLGLLELRLGDGPHFVPLLRLGDDREPALAGGGLDPVALGDALGPGRPTGIPGGSVTW